MSTPAIVKARRFVVNRIVDQAKRDAVSLSEVEIAMLGFERASAGPDAAEPAGTFAREYEDDAYEVKVLGLIRDVYKHDHETGKNGMWEQSLEALADENTYLRMLLEKAGIYNPATQPWYVPEWRTLREFVPAAVMVIAGILVLFTPLGARLVPNPILRLIVAVCCWLSPWLINKLTEPADEGTENNENGPQADNGGK